MLGLSPSPFLFCWGRGEGAQGRFPAFWSPKRNQPMACTLALCSLKFGPTGRIRQEALAGGGGGGLCACGGGGGGARVPA